MAGPRHRRHGSLGQVGVNPLWLTGRATGLVSLTLLSATVVLGQLGAAGFESPRWPRFVVGGLHRNLSLLAVAFLAVHVTTAVVDPYAGIGWLETVVPFTSSYEPFALGLGSIALDLMLATVATSLLRLWMPLRAWRVIHVTTYVLWPIAVVHGLLIGGADSSLSWVIVLDLACVLAVVAAALARLSSSPPTRRAAPVPRGRARAGR